MYHHLTKTQLIVDIHLDPGFAAFYDWTLKNNVPVIILSSGMEPIIRALLAKLIGPKAEAIPIVSNGVEISPDGSWQIIFRDESRTFPIPVHRSLYIYVLRLSFSLPSLMIMFDTMMGPIRRLRTRQISSHKTIRGTTLRPPPHPRLLRRRCLRYQCRTRNRLTFREKGTGSGDSLSSRKCPLLSI